MGNYSVTKNQQPMSIFTFVYFQKIAFGIRCFFGFSSLPAAISVLKKIDFVYHLCICCTCNIPPLLPYCTVRSCQCVYGLMSYVYSESGIILDYVCSSFTSPHPPHPPTAVSFSFSCSCSCSCSVYQVPQ